MLQSFNIIARGDARAPYTYSRSHKVALPGMLAQTPRVCANIPALSVVTPIWGPFSIQSGSFFCPAGQSALAEHGLFVALWAKS